MNPLLTKPLSPAKLKELFPNASPAFLAANGLLTTSVPIDDPADPEAAVTITESTDEQKLNKLERAWLAELHTRGYAFIMCQAVTLKLGFDTRYTVDFTALSPEGKRVAFETKGPFFREDAQVKLKTAARMFRHLFTFYLVTKPKGKDWIITEVKP